MRDWRALLGWLPPCGLVWTLLNCGGGGGSQSAPPPAPVAQLATLGTPSISGITTAGALVSANVTADGGGNITARGVVFGLNANPTLTDTKTSDGGLPPISVPPRKLGSGGLSPSPFFDQS